MTQSARPLLLACVLLFSAAVAQGKILPGDVVILPRGGGSLVVIDHDTGLASELPVALGFVSFDIAIGSRQRIYVITGDHTDPNALLEINAHTLAVTPVSPSIPFEHASALDVDARGNIILAARLSDSSQVLLRIDPNSGLAEILSSDGLLSEIASVLVLQDGAILASSRVEGVVRVEPETGDQSLLASIEELGFPSLGGGALAQTSAGSVLFGASPDDSATILDPITGEVQAQLLFPPASNSQQDLAISPEGDLLILGLHSLQRFEFDRLQFEDVVSPISGRMRRMVVMPNRARLGQREGIQNCGSALNN